MAQRWQQQRQGDAPLAFGASGRDADDYYDFLPSDDEELSGDEEHSGGAVDAAAQVPSGQDIAAMASVPLTGVGTAATTGSIAASSSSSSSAVFTPTGSLGASDATSGSAGGSQQRPTPETLALVASGAVILSGGKQLRVSPESLAKHASRKSQLESALDAMSRARDESDRSAGSALATPVVVGEAPFRFRASPASADVEMSDVGATAGRVATSGRAQTASKKLDKKASADNGNDADPLYDDDMDDADEKWVQRNFRGEGGMETDATLCCPCCFMTVCMDCQRHTTYTNQYRSSAAVNCRIKKDEILTYASGAASASSLPFQKRLNMAATRTSASGEAFSLLLTANEFYPVACSDCGTTVGVYDRHQQYHFFNVLPSNC